MTIKIFNVLLVPLLVLNSIRSASAEQELNLSDIKKLAGCYLVDYSYSEEKVIDPNYNLDPRIYDVGSYTVKELVKVVDEDSDSVRLQHFMQADDFSGATIFKMRHHAEVWRKNPSYRYRYLGRFKGNDKWNVEELDTEGNFWLREILSLDDGPRYQCLGQWSQNYNFPRFSCQSFSPIPGRETRDMGRSDYNTMERTSTVVMYPKSWLEKQKNIKVQFENNLRNRLVEEHGKIWSVRVPDEECSEVSNWAKERQAVWDILSDVWKDHLNGQSDFHEIKKINGSTRGEKIAKLIEKYFKTIGSNAEHAQIVKTRISQIIDAHRK